MTITENIELLETQLAWLKKHRPRLELLSFVGEFFGKNCYDFNSLNHQQVMLVIQVFGGKWSKTPNESTIDYETEFDGYRVRCWQGEPPPACQIVEVEEFVPAQPSTTRKVRKLVCPPNAHEQRTTVAIV